MQLQTIHNTKIAEVISEGVVIGKTEDGLDLLGEVYFQGFEGVIIAEKNITPDFFDLKNGMAGEILQKFSTYRVRLAITGDFSRYSSNSLRDFIFESNQRKHICFVASREEALAVFS
ncbi:MAG: DUF4180 domain-containing protein [Bacteroidia bacterium]|nr:DUF4180 domain-containing protein [Bacteroidia bacterium]